VIKIIIEALDSKVITPRTGKSRVNGSIKALPKEDDYLMVIFDESEGTESPGVFTKINNLELIGNEYRYIDYNNRNFSIIVKGVDSL
jgi:hypothetical protein